MNEIESIARCMAAYTQYPDIQLIQTGFRKQIVDAWGIQPGAKILEVGCGQGDMTAVLAHAVGAEGHVTACDTAAPDYGAPVTLGDSTSYLQQSALGARITFRLNYDVLAEADPFPSVPFDYIVFAHCSWYFNSLDHLKQTLIRIRPWAQNLCFSEWDLVPQETGQLAHMLAVLIQGQVEAFNENSSSNIRTPFTKDVFEELLGISGWEKMKASSVDSPGLQDAQWEIYESLHSSVTHAIEIGLPGQFVDLLKSEVNLLKKAADIHGKKPLSSFIILAKPMDESVPQG